jgi:lipoprotein-anchoring transpeptidase ErfK/SrfK
VRTAAPASIGTAVAKVRAAPNACAHNRAPQKIIVSIARQHMWLCARHRLVRDNPVTTGMATPSTRTPTGNFHVQYRVRNTTLTLNTGATYAVRYWIPFEGPLYGFHDSSWQKFPYGSPRYKTHGSHGCVHMPLRAIAFLYRWTARPTAVHIA